MRLLLSGKRALTPIGFLAGFAIACLCASSLFLTLDYRGQLSDNTKAFRAYQQKVYDRCLQRVIYDRNTDAWKQAVEAYYDDLHTNILSNAAFKTPFYVRLLTKVEVIQAKAKLALNRPKDSGCAAFRP